jgi:hypothetical protein
MIYKGQRGRALIELVGRDAALVDIEMNEWARRVCFVVIAQDLITKNNRLASFRIVCEKPQRLLTKFPAAIQLRPRDLHPEWMLDRIAVSTRKKVVRLTLRERASPGSRGSITLDCGRVWIEDVRQGFFARLQPGRPLSRFSGFLRPDAATIAKRLSLRRKSEASKGRP